MLQKIFPTNEGALDRVVRGLLGLGLLSLAFVGPKTPWGFVGILPLVTAAIGSCPLYTVLGIRTCAPKSPGT